MSIYVFSLKKKIGDGALQIRKSLISHGLTHNLQI